MTRASRSRCAGSGGLAVLIPSPGLLSRTPGFRNVEKAEQEYRNHKRFRCLYQLGRVRDGEAGRRVLSGVPRCGAGWGTQAGSVRAVGGGGAGVWPRLSFSMGSAGGEAGEKSRL